MGDKKHNVFISHHGKDDEHVQRLKTRLKEKGYQIRNASIESESKKYQSNKKTLSDKTIARWLRKGINWAGTFICLVGEKTHTRPWVNYEIRKAHLQGKQIIGIYKHGCNNSVELPEALKRYQESIVGWNSLEKLGSVMEGKTTVNEKPDSSPSNPIYQITRVRC